MNFVGDSITYKIVIKNKSNEDYEIDGRNLSINTDYFDYTINDNDSVVIGAKKTKELLLTIKYKNEIPVSSFVDGKTNSTKEMNIIITSFTNPNTGILTISTIIILLTLGFVGYIINKKELQKQSFSLVFIMLLLPIVIHATCEYKINIKMNVEVSRIAVFDTGVSLNYKMGELAVYNNNIIAFKRSNTLPSNIKDLVDSQIEQMNNVTITDEMVNEELQRINDLDLGYDGFEIQERHGIKYYCAMGSCEIEKQMKENMVYNFAEAVYGENHDNRRYLTYIESTNNLEVLDEEDFKKELYNHLYQVKRKEILKNVFSSNKSNYIIYGWYDSGNIYYYCESEEVYLNPNSSYIFYSFNSLEDLSGIKNINTSKVTTMSSMFYYVGNDGQDISVDFSNWNTSNVRDMSFMFDNFCTYSNTCKINGLTSFDTSNVTDMSGMFSVTANNINTEEFELDLTSFDTSKVTNMAEMFNSVGVPQSKVNIKGIENFNTSKVQNMSYMFAYLNISSDVFELDVSNFDTSNVTSMAGMFDSSGLYSPNINLDLSNFNTSNVEDMNYMFASFGTYSNSVKITGLSNFDTSKVEDMNNMFAFVGYYSNSVSITGLSNWNTSRVKDMSNMFNGFAFDAPNVEMDNKLNWNISKVDCMAEMFKQAFFYTNEISLDLSSWDTSKVEDMKYVFKEFGYQSQNVNLNLSNWVIREESLQDFMMNLGFAAKSLTLNASNWKLPYMTKINTMGSIGGASETINLNFSNWDISKVTSLKRAFYLFGGDHATTINLDVSHWDTSNVTDMTEVFNNFGRYVTNLNIDVSTWNTSKVETMKNMFASAGLFSETFSVGNLSSWDTSKVTDMTNMFGGAGLYATWSSIGTLKVYADNISKMFKNCKDIKGSINLYKNATATDCFSYAGTTNDSMMVINYSSAVTNIDSMFTFNSHIVKGELLD